MIMAQWYNHEKLIEIKELELSKWSPEREELHVSDYFGA